MKAAIILCLVGLAVAQQGFGGGGFGGSSGGRFGGSSGAGFGGGNSNRFTGRNANRPSTGFGPSTGGFGGPAGFFNPCARIEAMFAGQRRDWGPKAWGPGLNNPCAFPPNPILMERALALAAQVPGTLVKVDTDGEVELTTQFGREANVIDVWGRDLTNALEF